MINLSGKKFSPIANSEGGRVAQGAVFTFAQTEDGFRADYSGEGFTDGHLIGVMTGETTARLVYHSRADNGDLQAGQAEAVFSQLENGRWQIAMDWQWLNGSQQSGQSLYEEIS